MGSDLPEDKACLTNQESEEDKISRRGMLVITAKAAVGLTLAPLSVVLADAQKDAMVNELLNEDNLAPVRSALGAAGYNSASSAVSFVGDINRDGVVNEKDLKIMSEEWLSGDEDALSNLDGSFTYIPGSASSAVYVDSRDYSMLANNWGKNSSAISAVSFFNLRSSDRKRFCNVRRRYPRPDC